MAIIGQPVATEQTRSGHIAGIDSGNVNPLYVEQYADGVEHQFLKDSIMRKYFNIKSVRGTDVVGSRRIGNVALQAVTRNQRPASNSPTFDNIQLKIDTIVLARSNTFLLEEFQESIDSRKEIAVEHGLEIGKFFDEAFVIQAIKACQITNVDPDGNNSGGWVQTGDWPVYRMNDAALGTLPSVINRTAPAEFKGGTVIVLENAADETDPTDLVAGIMRMCQAVEEKDVEISTGTLLMRPAQYYTLLENDKLLDADFSTGNGDYAKGKVLKINNLRVEITNRFPSAAATGHFLSNAGNGNAYDTTTADANCVAVYLTPKALLAGETIPLTSDVYYDKKEVQWFIDSYLSFGVTPSRSDATAGLFTSTPTT